MAKSSMAAAALPTAIPAMAGVGNPCAVLQVPDEDCVEVAEGVAGLIASAVVIMIRVVGWCEVMVSVEVTCTVVWALRTL